jgi:hypothetical protein
MSAEKPVATRSLIRRAARRTGKYLLYALGAITLLTIVLLLSVDTDMGRRAIANNVNTRLDALFQGKVHIARIGHIGLDGISGLDVDVTAPDGKRVIAARGIAAHGDVIKVARAARGDEPLVINVTQVSLDGAEVSLDNDDAGVSDIERAFTLRDPGRPSTSSSRPFQILVDDADLRAIHVVRTQGDPIDGHVAHAQGRVGVDDTYLVVALAKLEVDATEPLKKHGLASGVVATHGAFVIPLQNPARARGSIDVEASVGGSTGVSATAHAFLIGTHVDVHANVPTTPPTAFASTPLPDLGIKLQKPASVDARVIGELSLSLVADVRVHQDPAEISAHGVLTLSPPYRLVLRADANHVDLAGVSEGLPTSDVSATLTLEADATKHGSYTLTTKPGVVDRVKLRALKVASPFLLMS